MKKCLVVLTILCTVWLCFRTEFTVGRVLDNSGNGKEYNGEPYYNYIHYDGYNENDIILTYFLYNPLNAYEDDIVVRKDFRIFKNVG